MTALQIIGAAMIAAGTLAACYLIQRARYDARRERECNRRALTPRRPGTHLGRHVADLNRTPTPTAADWAERLTEMEGSHE